MDQRRQHSGSVISVNHATRSRTGTDSNEFHDKRRSDPKCPPALAALEDGWGVFLVALNDFSMDLKAGYAATMRGENTPSVASLEARRSRTVAALKDGWAESSNGEKVIHGMLMVGALFLLFLATYPYPSSSDNESIHNISTMIPEVFKSTTHITSAAASATASVDAIVDVEAYRFTFPIHRADTLTSQSQLELEAKITEELPECTFLTMDINELPAQYREEYQSVTDFTATPRGAVALYGTTPSSESACVNNPLMQRLTSRHGNTPMNSLVDPTLIRVTDKGINYKKTINLPECISNTAKTGTVTQLKNDPLWVITMETTTTTLSETSFRSAGFKPELTSAVNGREVLKGCQGSELSAGILGIRLSFRKLLLRALREGHERVIIVEDDVVLEDDFSKHMDFHLNTQRCGGFMFDDSTGGVLLLGASEYGGVGLMKGGVNYHRDKCYNVNGYTYGAYASVYHRNVFLPILAWLDAPEYKALPLDHIYKHLALRGFIVRVLKPMAALADIIHSSSTTELSRTFVDKLDVGFLIWRSCLMHWDLQNFEHYRALLESRHMYDFTRRRYCHRTVKTLSNYRDMHNAVVLIHSKPDIASLSNLASMLVARWQAKLDGRYEGFIARPFIVIEAPPGMPPMDINDMRNVVLGMRTQTFNAHQERVEQALDFAGGSDVSPSSSSFSSSAPGAAVVRRLVLEVQAPVLVLDSEQLEELKRTLFKQPIAQMYIELRTQTPWVPTDAQMIELLEATKLRGRHWYLLEVDPSEVDPSSQAGEEDEEDSGSGVDSSSSAAAKPFPVPELVLSWTDVQQTSSDWLEILHKYSAVVTTIAQQIQGLKQGTFESQKTAVIPLEEEVNEHVLTGEYLDNKVQGKESSLVESSVFARSVEHEARVSYEAMRAVQQLKKDIHKQGVFLD